MATNMQSVYKKNALNTASPGDLTLMLYNGCLKFITQAEQAIEKEDSEARHIAVTKAQNIIRELMVTLKTDSEIGENMMRMYDFVLARLIDANVRNDLKALGEAKEIVTSFRDMWKEVISIDRKNRHGEGSFA